MSQATVRPHRVIVAGERATFVRLLKETGHVGKALKRAGLTRETVEAWREQYPLFAAAWDTALNEHRELYKQQQDRKLQQKTLQQTGLTVKQEMVWQELAAIAFTHVRQVMEWDGQAVKLIPSEHLPPYVSAAVQSVKAKSRVYRTEDGRSVTETDIEVRLHDKIRALESLRREFASYQQQQQFMDAFTALVLKWIPDIEGQQAVLRFLEAHAGGGALADIPGGFGSGDHDPEAAGISR